MTAGRIFTPKYSAVEDCPLPILHRFCAIGATGSASPNAKEGNLVRIVDVSTVSVKVFDDVGTQIGSTLTPSAASVFYDTLQTAAIWGELPLGGNFRYILPATCFPSGASSLDATKPATNRVEIIVTLTDNTPLPAIWSMPVIGLLGS